MPKVASADAMGLFCSWGQGSKLWLGFCFLRSLVWSFVLPEPFHISKPVESLSYGGNGRENTWQALVCSFPCQTPHKEILKCQGQEWPWLIWVSVLASMFSQRCHSVLSTEILSKYFCHQRLVGLGYGFTVLYKTLLRDKEEINLMCYIVFRGKVQCET